MCKTSELSALSSLTGGYSKTLPMISVQLESNQEEHDGYRNKLKQTELILLLQRYIYFTERFDYFSTSENWLFSLDTWSLVRTCLMFNSDIKGGTGMEGWGCTNRGIILLYYL